MAFLEEYTLLDELGQGGYATVYKVRHNNLGYIRAIRVLKEIIARGENDDIYKKFLEECRLLLRLGNGNHPNIVHIYQPLLKDQRAIVEMDFVDGKDLYHYLEDKHSFVEIKDVLRLLSDIGSALSYCHEDIYKFCMDKDEDNLQDDPEDGRKVLLDNKTKQRLINKYRVIHNDIHSGNIVRREDGSYVLLDFGLAIEGNDVVRSSRRKKGGAPQFKAPEKWENEAILTTQSDIYSFGVVLYEYLTGRVPFLFDTKNSNSIEAEYLLSKAHKEQIPPSIFELRKSAFENSHVGEIYEKDYPDWLETLIMKCLAKSPNDRFKNGKELYSFVLKYISTDTDGQVQELKKEIEALQAEIVSLNRNENIPNKAIDEFVVNLQEQLNEVMESKKLLEIKNYEIHAENDLLKKQQFNYKYVRIWKYLLALCVFAAVLTMLYIANDKTIYQASIDNSTLDTIIADRDSINGYNNRDITIVEDVTMEKVIDSLNSEISRLRGQIKEKDREKETLKNELLNSSVADSQSEIEEKNRIIKSLNSEISKLREQIKKKDIEIEVLRSEIIK